MFLRGDVLLGPRKATTNRVQSLLVRCRVIGLVSDIAFLGEEGLLCQGGAPIWAGAGGPTILWAEDALEEPLDSIPSTAYIGDGLPRGIPPTNQCFHRRLSESHLCTHAPTKECSYCSILPHHRVST